MRKSLFIAILMFAVLAPAFAQTDRKEVRHGNREFKKESFQEAEIDYKKALMKDSLSNAANFNIGNTYYRMENYSEADRHYAAVIDSLDRAGHGAESYFNQGDSFLKQRNWQGAVEAFKNSLRRNPDDMDAKSNLAYAQKMLENQQQGGGGQNQDQQNQQSQDQNQDNNDQNQDQQNQDQNQGDQDQQNQDQNQDNNDSNQNQQDQQNQQGQSGEQPKISPQAAQQMLQAIQDQEKQTQDKVRKEKAAKVKSKQKDKNW